MYRIMLVDDEENMLSVLRRNLAPLCCELETFTRPRQALARAGEIAFDLVISDYRMPEMDGVALIKELKRIQPGMMAIILSGLADLHSIMNAVQEAEIYRCLTKPWDADKLNATISQAFEQRASVRKVSLEPARQAPKSKGAMAALEAKYPGITKPGTDWIAGAKVSVAGRA